MYYFPQYKISSYKKLLTDINFEKKSNALKIEVKSKNFNFQINEV